ncbi:hypothetical protein N9Y63_00555 [Akkermansiaceae bacterium]|mgnify:CR=1 FL=1|jgi:hypothetical protein|nr:hypothetical protein [Opitutaceae bacterium]MDA7515335.1 hypothetical protein [Akkermansiaceae bacterium]MDB2639327.1 hypothetical protein [Akkermansiaceae bacterium]
MKRSIFLAILLLPISLSAASVEGYAGRVSYAPGESVTLHVSSTAPKFSAEFTRLGAERISVWKKDDIVGAAHPTPKNASAHGCNWPSAISVPIPADWKSGYYHVTLSAPEAKDSSCYFVLRESPDTAEPAPILLELSTNTYNAYNNWGGFSLYAYNGRNKVQGHRVSFHRPPRSLFGNWEHHFVAWAEKQEIPLAFAVNSDLEFHPDILKKRRLVISVGHDEYWSAPMRDHLESFIGDGGNVAFFSGNTCCWQVRSEDDGNALTCWKQTYQSDPVFEAGKSQALLSSLWSHHLIDRPENTLTGVGFLWGGYHKSHGQHMDGSGAFTAHRTNHWIFKGTDLKRGDAIGGKHTVVGYECDGCEIEWRDKLPFPTHRDGTPKNFKILATAPARWHPDDSEWYEKWEKGREGNAVLGIYERNGTVVTTGTTDWAHGLRGGDPVVERITKNIIEKLSRPK